MNCEERIDPCKSFNCFNNATCITSSNNTVECSCPPGYTGPQCQFKISTCSILCQNGGVCNSTSNGCLCPSEYEGSDCGYLKSLCSLNPCKNGICVDSKNTTAGFNCSCVPGFTGQNCDIPLTVCDSNPCGANGVCELMIIANSTNQQSYRCNCFQPYTGRNCLTRLTLCDFINCGEGVCSIDTLNPFNASCICREGYTGQYCNIKMQGLGNLFE
jgi:hypothetical protein